MKKVGIITFHNSRSYGACLQAIATVYMIRNMGYQAEVIDYVNLFEQKRYKADLDNFIVAMKYIRWKIKTWLSRDEYWLQRAFGNTKQLYSDAISSEHYTKIEELSNLKYDVLLVGSDQVWNSQITEKLDTVFLLDFGQSPKRISYASSMGSHRIEPNEEKLFRHCLKRFSFISVREKFAMEELRRILDIDVEIVLDPTLLLTKEQWTDYILQVSERIPVPQEPYILTFFVGKNISFYREQVFQIKEKKQLPVYNIQTNKRKYISVDRVLAGVTCGEFVQWIQNAAYIITDSFHGTAFSLLYQKQFTSISNTVNPIRVKELLESVGLQERLDSPQNCDREIEYHAVNKKLNELRSRSIKWLQTALESIQ